MVTGWCRIAREIDDFLGELARERKLEGPINWADLHVTDIEQRKSLLDDKSEHMTVVIIEEANSQELRAAVMTWIINKGYAHLIHDVEVDW